MKNKHPIYRTGIGQDSHRFLSNDSTKSCILAGIIFDDMPGLAADSDGDVIFHAICNAITSITHAPILASLAQDLCKNQGITDSKIYLEKAFESLGSQQIQHLSITIEAQRPRMQKKIDLMRQKIAQILKLGISQVGITATSGDGLTDFGCGDGIQAFCVISTIDGS
ncbi:MAG: 2-C-methyl-D-erythritol 2,4-cyclodiphosphate synthase [Candidatus Anoxychlamydiales bacterium]|nr:2-C-methyl-D-erythritol 2,4-cyclodiphosphate synthase [Candidatus Anoxychlamydiales bacterium]